MAIFHYSLFSCCGFLLLAYTLLQSPQVYGRETESRQVFSVSSLLPSSVCSSSRDSNPSMLKVINRHGPCSPLTPGPKLASAELLNQDQARVNWLHRRISTASNQSSTRASLAATIPASSGGPIGTGNYVVEVGFGTPKEDFTVIFDTGSDVTWIQCLPCNNSSCYPQQEPLFDPSQSSTYCNISCGTSECLQLDTYGCSAGRCRYLVAYGDNSTSEGFFGSDTLALSSDVLPDFLFGCGDKSNGLFGMADGLLGLGRGSVSLVSQSNSKYGGVFSYCLPSTSSSTGYLKLGDGAPSNVQFTPMLRFSNVPSFYFLSLVAIKVGGDQLPISPAVFSNVGTLIDSGTVITRLPPSAYAALKSRFRQLMTMYKMAPPLSILDTCYDFTGNDTVTVPTVELVFDGGATLNVDFTGILYVFSVSQACLAFAGNEDKRDPGIIGNAQQKRFNVVYDIPNSRIGFGANGCS